MFVIDLECIRPPVPKKGEPLGKYEYANGWNDYVGMGISVFCMYNYNTNLLESYTKDEIGDGKMLTECLSGDLVAGFNILKYDNPMLRAHGVIIDDLMCYDIYFQILYALGLDPHNWDRKTHTGYSLDAMLKANGLPTKTGSGADAPYMWQDGKYNDVIEYCKNDVIVEKALLDKIFNDGYLISPKDGSKINMSLPSL